MQIFLQLFLHLLFKWLNINELKVLFRMFLLKHPILPLRIRKQARAYVYGIELTYPNLLLIYTDSK